MKRLLITGSRYGWDEDALKQAARPGLTQCAECRAHTAGRECAGVAVRERAGALADELRRLTERHGTAFEVPVSYTYRAMGVEPTNETALTSGWVRSPSTACFPP